MAELRSYFACYDPRFVLWALAAAVVVVVAAVAGRAFDPATPARLALAAVQAATLGGLILAIVLRVRHLDELQRRIQFESLGIAFAVSCAAIQGWGFFENAGLPGVDWGRWAWPFMVAIWGVALLVVRRRYA